jgi:hypothetical protein
MKADKFDMMDMSAKMSELNNTHKLASTHGCLNTFLKRRRRRRRRKRRQQQR